MPSKAVIFVVSCQPCLITHSTSSIATNVATFVTKVTMVTIITVFQGSEGWYKLGLFRVSYPYAYVSPGPCCDLRWLYGKTDSWGTGSVGDGAKHLYRR